MLKTNCIRQPQSYFPVHLATTIHALNSLITAVLPSPGYNFLTTRFETHTRTLRYGLRSREIYIEERTPITCPEILTEPQETQDESVNTIQETPNSQFRLFLSVTPCMPRIDSKKSATCIPSPPLFSPPTGDSPQNQSPPLHLAPPPA